MAAGILYHLPTWYCNAYVRDGEVTYAETLRALVEMVADWWTELIGANPIWLELLSLISAAGLLVTGGVPLGRWGAGTVTVSHLYALLWRKRLNRAAAFHVAALYWALVAVVLSTECGLPTNIPLMGIAVSCLLAGRVLWRRDGPKRANGS